MKRILKYQKQSLDLISKSMGLPTFDEMIENEIDDAIEEKHQQEQGKYMDARENEGFKWGEPPINKE